MDTNRDIIRKFKRWWCKFIYTYNSESSILFISMISRWNLHELTDTKKLTNFKCQNFRSTSPNVHAKALQTIVNHTAAASRARQPRCSPNRWILIVLFSYGIKAIRRIREPYVSTLHPRVCDVRMLLLLLLLLLNVLKRRWWSCWMLMAAGDSIMLTALKASPSASSISNWSKMGSSPSRAKDLCFSFAAFKLFFQAPH